MMLLWYQYGIVSSRVAGAQAAEAASIREQAEQEAANAAESRDGANEVLWRVNTEELNRRFRHALCVDMAKDRFGPETGQVLEAMLAAGRAFETQVGSHL